VNRRYVHLPLPVPTLAEVVLAVLLGLSLFAGRGCTVPDWPWPAPAPAPPAPEPEPTPVVTGRLWVSYVVPPDATPAQAAIRTDPMLRATLKGLDAEWLTYTVGEEDLPRLRLQAAVDATGAPCAIIQGSLTSSTATGPEKPIIERIPSPTREQIVSAVRRLRGE
jgi:hypothetical protein